MFPSKNKHGLFIEMKRSKTGKPTPEQLKFIERCVEVGYEAKLAYGWKDATDIVKEYLGGDLNAF